MSLGKQLALALLILAVVPGTVVSIIALRQVILVNQLWESAGMEEALASSVTVVKQSLRRMEVDLAVGSGPLIERWRHRAPDFNHEPGERRYVAGFLDDLDFAFVQVYAPDSSGVFHLESAVYPTQKIVRHVDLSEEITRWRPGSGVLQSTTGAFARVEELGDGKRVAVGHLLAADFFGRLSELQLGLGTYRALAVYARVFRTRVMVLMASILLLVAALSITSAWLLSKRLAGPVTDLAGQIQSNPLAVRFTKPPGATSEVVDLTNALNRLTESLRRAERAAGTAQVARRVAHEIRNPLSTLGLAVGRLERRFDALPAEDRRVAGEVIAAMRKEFEVLDDMAESFSVLGSMSEPPLRRPVDWNTVAKSVCALYDESPVQFQLDLDEGLPPVAGDERSLRRALTNLVKNAIEAQEGQGSVTVRTARQGGQALVEVRDQGPGLSPAARERLFVPGFTTKEGGSGLGLFLARSIVEHHGGRIEVDSGAAGTVIRLRFPAAGADAPAA